MAGIRIDIMKLRDLILLKEKGKSNRSAADLLGVSRNTVNSYVRLISSYDLDYKELLTLSDKELQDLFPSESEVDSYRYRELSSYFLYFERELKKPGCTQQTLWKEYIEKHPDGYKHSQFNHHFNQWRTKLKASCKLEHKVAEKLFIDFTGKKLQYVDKQTGELIEVNVFVGILPASGYTFVRAVPTQSTEDVVDALNHCLDYIGGVPLAIVPDNMKAAVVQCHKYAPRINRTLRDFARHYGCVIDPTRPYSPQDKAMVEGAVKLVYQRIFYPLSKHTFFSLENLNEEIKGLLEGYNRHCFSQSNSTREQEFLSLEKSYLQGLPDEKYELRYFKKYTVQKMGHIYLTEGKHYYSVPYRFIGKKVTVCYNKSSVEIFYKKERIAFHKRSFSPGKYTTDANHLSSSHKAYSEWNLEYFQVRAKKTGPYVHQYVTELILERSYPEIAYKQSNGILQLVHDYPKERIDKACERALGHGSRGYHIIENILKRGLDKETFVQHTKPHIPAHQNIRGAESYN